MNKDTTGWDWPDELDALTAAPANHRLLLENERVRARDSDPSGGAHAGAHPSLGQRRVRLERHELRPLRL